MNLVFTDVRLENFKAIGEAEVKLSNRGIVMVKGVNAYEDTAASNGSGKSSIFSGLFWAIYGKTPEGITNPANRYNSGSCQVILRFSVDSNEYVVTRRIKGTSQVVELLVNGCDKSGRNRTDTDKLIREDILQMSPDIFLSLVYLSQGFGSRLSLLTPILRKERLENLTDTAKTVNSFSDTFSKFNSDVAKDVLEAKNEISRFSGSHETYTDMYNQLQAKLIEYANRKTSITVDGVEYDSSHLESLGEALQEVSSKYADKHSELIPVQTNLSNANTRMSQVEKEIRASESSLSSVESRLSSVMEEARCPTCSHVLEEEKKAALSKQYEQEKKDLEELIVSLNCSRDKGVRIIQDLTLQVSSLRSEASALEKEKNRLREIIRSIPRTEVVDTDSIQKQMAECESSTKELEEKMQEVDKNLVLLENKQAVISHCRQLISKQFRAYLLHSAIVYLNTRLSVYSKALFSNEGDTVSLSADSQKLDISLGEASYETLSGGEQRRVDLIMMLAQRDLASEVAGMSCNVLIMDEIMESMDETATQSALSLLESQSLNVDSMFIISHNDYSLPIDSVITVTKGADRVATVSSN